MEQTISPKIKLLLLLSTVLFLTPFYAFGQASNSANLNLMVGSSCGNGICEPGLGETSETCPSDCPPAPSGGPTGGTSVVTVLTVNNLAVSNISVNSAEVSWSTTKDAMCQLIWGKDTEYGQEAISETDYKPSHFAQILNLNPSNTYHFQIACIAKNQEIYTTQDQQFQTRAILNNVSGLSAVPGDRTITLSWQNPTDLNFNGVVILKSENFYPLNVNDGSVIYQGYGNYFQDTGLANGTTYYYGVFVKDKNGNYSSGAVISATPNGKIPAVTPTPTPVLPPIAGITPTSTPIPTVSPVPIVPSPTIGDFNFSADGVTVPVQNRHMVSVHPNSSINISINCGKLSGLKGVIINLQEQKGTSQTIYSYMLNQNGGNNACNVSFVAPSNSGIYPIDILFINAENNVAGRISARLNVLAPRNTAIAIADWEIYYLVFSGGAVLMFWFLLSKIGLVGKRI